MKRRLGLIGSFEMRNDHLKQAADESIVVTPYGAVTARVRDDGLVSIRRGRDGLASHMINHRANITALAQLGVTDVVSTAMVGTLNADTPIGTTVLLDQFLDFTKRTRGWFYDDDIFRDFDYTNPFCSRLRGVLRNALGHHAELRDSGCYVGVDGPRFETAAEVRMYALLGGDVIGMTIVSECIMAREAGMCYAAIANVVNYGAGLTAKPVHADDFLGPGNRHVGNIMTVVPPVARQVQSLVKDRCECGQDGSRTLDGFDDMDEETSRHAQ